MNMIVIYHLAAGVSFFFPPTIADYRFFTFYPFH